MRISFVQWVCPSFFPQNQLETKQRSTALKRGAAEFLGVPVPQHAWVSITPQHVARLPIDYVVWYTRLCLFASGTRIACILFRPRAREVQGKWGIDNVRTSLSSLSPFSPDWMSSNWLSVGYNRNEGLSCVSIELWKTWLLGINQIVVNVFVYLSFHWYYKRRNNTCLVPVIYQVLDVVLVLLFCQVPVPGAVYVLRVQIILILVTPSAKINTCTPRSTYCKYAEKNKIFVVATYCVWRFIDDRLSITGQSALTGR